MKRNKFFSLFFIAKRYLFAKKKHNIINIISIISTVGIMASTAALIIVLSVFNGMSELVEKSFNTFNPDFKITLLEGKSFSVTQFPKAHLAALPEVKSVEEVVSDIALLSYNDHQELVRLKGVSADYPAINKMNRLLIDGTFTLEQAHDQYAVMGAINAGIIQLNLNNRSLLKLYYPKRTKKNFANPADAFSEHFLIPSGVFASNTAYDEEYVFCSLPFARSLMDYENEVTSMEIKLNHAEDYTRCQNRIKAIVGDDFLVQNKYEQEALLFKTMKSEKLIIFIILSFILIIAVFNIIGTLGMLIIEKKNDIVILNSLGASSSFVQQIFICEGMIISFFGGLMGIIFGYIICFIQQTFHIIKLGNAEAGYVISYYPVKMELTDFVAVIIFIFIISLITAAIPSKNIKAWNTNIQHI